MSEPRHDVDLGATYWAECQECRFEFEGADKRRVVDEAEKHAFTHSGSVSYGAIQ